ncbi:hypothetical protein ACFVYD_17950 [Streptomyces sp. NPDC058301]|uniref:hypothetical protein n=1 Tax=Streptomyces sp. NPDC058301 TaxID=3346436 RepID=UPI0036E96B33
MSVPVSPLAPRPSEPSPSASGRSSWGRTASVRRRLGFAAGAALLTLATAACSAFGRTAVGTFSYATAAERVVKISSPPIKGCHRMAPTGATAVLNNTLTDVRVYRTLDCRGKEMAYIPSRLGDNIAPNTLPWRSYAFVH